MLRLFCALSIIAAASSARAGDTHEPRLAGEWVFGVGTPEPPAGVVKRMRRCYAGGVTTVLDQKGTKVSGNISWYPPVGGVEPRIVIRENESLLGTRSGNQVKLTGTYERTGVPQDIGGAANDLPHPVHAVHKYVLVYDPKTQHLVGTRDGQPFWAAPVRWMPMRCGPPPP